MQPAVPAGADLIFPTENICPPCICKFLIILFHPICHFSSPYSVQDFPLMKRSSAYLLPTLVVPYSYNSHLTSTSIFVPQTVVLILFSCRILSTLLSVTSNPSSFLAEFCSFALLFLSQHSFCGFCH